MNAEQLRETTMDPASRTLQQVTIDDAAMAERIFSDLMGDKVEPRKEFIDRHAQDGSLHRCLDVGGPADGGGGGLEALTGRIEERELTTEMR